jgi:hypothetical protein
MARGSRKPLSSSPPNINPPRRPSAGVKSPNAPPRTVPSKPTKPKKPVTKPNPPKGNVPTKPSMLGNVGSGLATGGALLGATTLLSGGAGGAGGLFGNLAGLAGQGIQTAGAVTVADKAIDAIKGIADNITENPMNLALVAGVIGVVIYAGVKK